jgi:hypothetical protein
MAFSLPCPNCGVKLTSSKPIPLGAALTCPKCKTRFTAGPGGDADASAAGTHPEPGPAPPPTESRRGSAVEGERPSRRPRDASDRPSRRGRNDDEYQEEEDERPSRRRRSEDFDDEDDRPRVRLDGGYADDDEGFEEPVSRRKAEKPKGYGLGVAGMILGIISIVIAVSSGGPFLCSMCCFAFAPISWVVSGTGAVVSAVGAGLSFMARSAGNRGQMAMWGIVLNLVAFVLSVAGVVILLVFGAAIVAQMDASKFPNPNPPPNLNQPNFNPPNNPAKNNPPVNPPKKAGNRHTYTRDQFRLLVNNDSDEQKVEFFLGKPDARKDQKGESTWTYDKLTTDGFPGTLDDSVDVVFRNGKVARVVFHAGPGGQP